MTSNIGSEHFRKLTNPLGFRSQQVGADRIEGEILREVERRFSPEFRNRIDEVVLFSPLARDHVREIARHHLATIEQTLTAAGKTIQIDDEALELLVSEGYSLAYGARFLKRVVDERIKLPISTRWRESDQFHVRAESGQFVVTRGSAEVVAA
jgi:ATP-dependent Clp protease ATP-binding subunit ClpA